MTVKLQGGLLSEAELRQFREEGYLIVKGLLKQEEIEHLKRTFMELHADGPIPGYFEPVSAEQAGGDILKQYPRMMHPHRYNQIAMNYMLHPRIMGTLMDLFGEEPLAAQSMFYFKPPGARGQALHQDNFYLKVEPGTCIAAWVAVDPADQENGGMVIVPKSNTMEIVCPHEADPEQSFTVHEVDVPEGLQTVPADMDAGDVLFFNGSVIHGSYPNRSKDRFRRAFICHYTGISATKIGHFYNPLYTYEGQALTLEANPDSGPCGEEYEASSPH